MRGEPQPANRMPEANYNQLPTQPGIYWWRETPLEEWRLVEIVKYTEGETDQAYLGAYDIEKRGFGGIYLGNWPKCMEIGQWIPVCRPPMEV